VTSDRTDKTFNLEDGRTLGYAEWGDPNGSPVFHFHGSSSSRLEHPLEENSLSNVRLVTIDRPGHGLSDFQRHRRLLDWPNDVTALADHLNIGEFAVSGWSFGGPYAMACAYLIPERLTAVALISSFAPYDRPGSTAGMARFVKVSLALGRRIPWIGRQFMKIQGRAITKDPEGTARRMLSSLPDVDQKILGDPRALEMLLPAMTEAYRNGSNGAAQEGSILVRPWGFRLADIAIPVEVWHGDTDVNNPLQSAHYLRDTISQANANILEGAGHFFILERWGEILRKLIS
jgi:pimeloyl-ACP methyl ester carboxylesterase